MQFRAFAENESGAITVDWVVLTAATVGMGLATMALINSGVEQTVSDIDAGLNAPSVIVRMYNGFGYDPYDSAGFSTLLKNVSSLDENDLQQMAAYSNQLNGMVNEQTDPAIAGQIADFNVAVDMAYANAKTTRHSGTEYDETELARISAEVGFDSAAMIDEG